MTAPYRVLMVCLGNICRSPTAEGVLRHKLAAAGLAKQVAVDSAGTGDWHVGHPPDARATRHASGRGYDLSALRARQVEWADFDAFDLILAMDDANLADLEALRPPDARAELKRLMAFAEGREGTSVADPYLGGAEGFEAVLDQAEAACDGLVAHLSRRLDGQSALAEQ